VTHGAARNTLQLMTAGSAVIQVDDDTVCRVARAVLPSDRAWGDSGQGGTQYWFLTDEEEACDAIEYVDADFVAAHEELLGASPRHLERLRTQGRLEIDIRQFLARRAGNTGNDGEELPSGVGVTLGGSIGDS